MRRSHETRIEIDAPIDEVWSAITEAEGIQRWLAPSVTVEKGAGGSISLDWGPGLEWKTAIEIWEPGKRLQTSETRDRILSSSPVDEPRMTPCKLLQDYFLETENGKTVLRLVHSGFGEGEDWELEYEGTRQGWAACFLRLKHGLERHRGEVAHNLIIPRACYGVDALRALDRVRDEAPPGRILANGSMEFALLMSDMNESIFVVSAQKAAIGSMVYVQPVLYGVTRDEAARFREQWEEKLARLFPAQQE